MKKNNSPKTRKIMVVAGEASGDTHAAKLVHALRETAPDTIFEFFGATSHNLRETEVETIVNSDNFSIVGLPEIGKALPMFWKAFQKLKRTAIERKPDAVILVPNYSVKKVLKSFIISRRSFGLGANIGFARFVNMLIYCSRFCLLKRIGIKNRGFTTSNMSAIRVSKKFIQI
jgi:hypothetical protein